MEGLVKNKTPELIPKTSEGKNHIFTKLGSEFKQVEVNNPNVSNKLIQSYLRENGVFDCLKHIKLPERNELDLNLRREQSIAQYRKYAVRNYELMKSIYNLPEDAILGCYCKPLDCHGDIIIEIWEYNENNNSR